MALAFGPILWKPCDIPGPIDLGHLQAIVYGKNRDNRRAQCQYSEQRQHRDHARTPEQRLFWGSRCPMLDHRPRRQFAGVFLFCEVLLGQVIRPVFHYVAHPVKNALMNMDTRLNHPRAPQIDPDTALPFWGRLPRHPNRIVIKLWPEFTQPPESVE